jgi:hypothetical protein
MQQLAYICGLAHEIGKTVLAGLPDKPSELSLLERRQLEMHVQ